MEMPNLHVDFSSPKAIRAALPLVQDEVDRARMRLTAARDELAGWTQLQSALETIAGFDHSAASESSVPVEDAVPSEPEEDETEPSVDDDDHGSQISAVDTVVPIVNELGGRVTIAQLSERMPNFKKKTVGWALWKATKEQRIKRVGQGVYAPLDYVELSEPNPFLAGMTEDVA